MALVSFIPAYATPIYKSVDAQGHVTYSTMPPTDAVQFERMDVPVEEDDGASAAHDIIIDEIRDTAARLEAERKQREQRREAARAKQHKDDASPQLSVPPQPIIQYYPVYPLRFRSYPRSRPHRQHLHGLSPQQHRSHRDEKDQ